MRVFGDFGRPEIHEIIFYGVDEYGKVGGAVIMKRVMCGRYEGCIRVNVFGRR